jgi:hypothetical protein
VRLWDQPGRKRTFLDFQGPNRSPKSALHAILKECDLTVLLVSVLSIAILVFSYLLKG